METPESLSSEQATPFPPHWTKEFREKLKNELSQAFSDYEMAWSEDFDRLYRCWEDYNSITKRTVSKNFSNVQLPIIQENIRITHARLWDAIGASNPLCLVDPVGQIAPSEQGDYSTMRKAADILQQIQNGLFDASGGRKQAMLTLVDGLSYGRMIAKTGWEQIFASDGKSYYPSREYPCFYRIEPVAFMCDPRCANIQESVRTFETISLIQHDAEQRVRMNFFDKEASAKLDFSMQPLTKKSEYQQKMLSDRKGQDLTYRAGYTDIVECLLRLDPDGDGMATMHTVWFDPRTKELLGARPCLSQGGKRPIVAGYLFPASGSQIYGISITELLHGLARAKSTLFNQYIDNVKLAQARYLVNPAAQINEHELKSMAPGTIIHGLDISEAGVRPFQAASNGAEILQAMAFLNGEIQQGSNVTEISQGMKSASTAFATGVLNAQSQSNFDIFADFARETFFNEAFGQLLNLTQTYLDMRVPATIDVAGIQGTVWVNRHDLAGKFTARCANLRLAGKRQATSQVLTSLLAVLMQTGADVRKVVDQILSLNDVPGFETFWPPSQPIMPMGAGPTGVAGQPNPNDAMPVQNDPNASRMQMKPGPGGDMPMGAASMPMMGGMAANG